MNSETQKLIYKLGVDACVLALVAFAGMLTAESILPGILSRYVTVAEASVGLVALCALVAWWGKKINYAFELKKTPRWLGGVLAIFALALLANALLSFSSFALAFIIVLCVALTYYLAKILLPQKN